MVNEHIGKIEITDGDIAWVQAEMKLFFDKESANIIKNLESVDIQAFPGSGKTTVLIAKLAILAKKWPYSNFGICVLSHTNVAREEIEERLGNNAVGKMLLGYPHFIGTFQSFFDTFLALPWLRSNGFSVNMIDSDIVLSDRWNKLPYNIKYGLKMKRKDKKICTYSKELHKTRWNCNGKIEQAILRVIEESQNEGNFTFEEMILYAREALESCMDIACGLQKRFPFVFVDEAQDTNSIYWALIQNVFQKNGSVSVQQRFGDSNQAIYDYFAEENVGEFPGDNPLFMSKSHRFDDRIAKLANTVAESQQSMSGTVNKFSTRKVCHTIYLFSKNKIKDVIEEFGQLILDTFNDRELLENKKYGCHVVGMIHIKNEEKTSVKQFPRGIYDYWPEYQNTHVGKNKNYKYFIDYIRASRYELEKNYELNMAIEYIARGLRRIINILHGKNFIPATNNVFRAILGKVSVDQHVKIRRGFLKILFMNSTTDYDWAVTLKSVNKFLEIFNLKLDENLKEFIKWIPDSLMLEEQRENASNKVVDHYLYKEKNGLRSVDLEFGSIHSVKGRTHLATLVLETYYYNHNMTAILPYLCNSDSNKKIKTLDRKRLRCHYVAMTRAKGLLCLALPLKSVGEVEQEALKKIGWAIKIIND